MEDKKGYKVTVVNLDTGATEVDTVSESVFGVVLDLCHRFQTISFTNEDPTYVTLLLDRVISEASKLIDKIEQNATPELKAALTKLLGNVWRE